MFIPATYAFDNSVKGTGFWHLEYSRSVFTIVLVSAFNAQLAMFVASPYKHFCKLVFFSLLVAACLWRFEQLTLQVARPWRRLKRKVKSLDAWILCQLFV